MHAEMSLRDGADAKTNTQPCIEMLVRAAALVSINKTSKTRSSLFWYGNAWPTVSNRPLHPYVVIASLPMRRSAHEQ